MTPRVGRPSRAGKRETQAILPLRGKVLNTEGAGLKKVLDNKELGDLDHRARLRYRARSFDLAQACATSA